MKSPNLTLPNGISSEILTSSGARFITFDKRPAISLPTMRGYPDRIMFTDSSKDKSKYKWAEKDKEHPPLFWRIPEGERLAIITNGEKATLVLAQQGIAACNTFGEGNELERAIAALQAAGVTSLIIVPDCDKAGVIAAHKWLDMGTAAGLEVAILDLGAYLGRAYFMQQHEYHKWDLRDLWLLLEQDSELFKEVLYKQIPHLNFEHYRAWLPDTTHQAFRPQSKEGRDSASLSEIQKLYDEWWNKVLAEVSATAPRGNIHKHQHCQNPHHADKNPSFRITEKLTPICTCYDARKRDNIAAWWNVISWKEFLKDRLKERREKDREKRQEVSRSRRSGGKERRKYDGLIALPAALRKAMIKDGLTNLCRLIDALLWSELPTDHVIKIGDMVRIMGRYDMSRPTVYRTMGLYSQKMKVVLEQREVTLVFETMPGNEYSLGCMLAVLEACYRYQIIDSGNLLQDHEMALCSGREYRLHSLLESIPIVDKKMTGKEMAAVFGLSEGTISAYTSELKNRGYIEITKHFKRIEITFDSVSELPTTIRELKEAHSNLHLQMFKENNGWRVPYLHKGGKKGIPNNRIPPLSSAAIYFIRKSIYKKWINDQLVEYCPLILIAVSKTCNSYRRLPSKEINNPVLKRLVA